MSTPNDEIVFLVWPDGFYEEADHIDDCDFLGRSDDFNRVHVPMSLSDAAIDWFLDGMPEPCPEGIVVR